MKPQLLFILFLQCQILVAQHTQQLFFNQLKSGKYILDTKIKIGKNLTYKNDTLLVDIQKNKLVLIQKNKAKTSYTLQTKTAYYDNGIRCIKAPCNTISATTLFYITETKQYINVNQYNAKNSLYITIDKYSTESNSNILIKNNWKKIANQ